MQIQGNCLLEITQLPKALETSFEGVAEVVKTNRFVGVIVRSEVNSISERRNCVFEVIQLPEALETSDQEVSEAVQKGRLVRVTTRGEVNSIPEC